MGTEKNTHSKSISNIQGKRRLLPSIDELYNGILKGDKVALARAITLVESTHIENLKKADVIIEKCLNKTTDSIRIRYNWHTWSR